MSVLENSRNFAKLASCAVLTMFDEIAAHWQTAGLSAQQTFIRCKPTSASASLWVKTQAYLRWVETDRFAQALLGRTRL
ncbi:MAG: hypothetical protein P8N80_04210, partial [Planktomarina sp.]|nr:hypothetical protein [Planktomarina sp.]